VLVNKRWFIYVDKMNRHLLAVRGVAVLLAAVAGCDRENGTAPPPPDEPPNIILILTDDQDAASVMVMPNVRTTLVTQGTTFQNFFVSDPICCPSRATILRGQYIHNHQILTNTSPQGGFSRFRSLGHEQSTIATWLQAAGYRTGLFGKYLNGYPSGSPAYVPPGWDAWYSPISGAQGGGWTFNYELNENGQIVAYGNQPADYFTDVLTQKATAFIRDASQLGTPFFVYVGTSAPHSPYTPAPRHQDVFAGTPLPRPPSFNEADVSDKPPWIRALTLLTATQINHHEAVHRARLASLLAIDDLLGQIVATLESTGERSTTFIFFTSDNGYHLGQHRMRENKTTPYEEDIRVPLIVRGPGVPAGRTLDQLVHNIDLAPTFAELGEASLPAFADGRSLVALLGPTPPSASQWRQALLIEFTTAGNLTPTWHAIRTRDSVYVEYTTGDRELYDLSADPFQLLNRAGSALPALIAEWAARLSALKQCAGSGCRTADNP
jgi:N-acetylglucosamine-6-sulfatase